MTLITRGLTSIKVGNVAADGGMGTSLATLGYTKKGTAKLNEEDGTTTDIPAEETDSPVDVITTAGKKTFVFELLDPDAAVLLKILGGTVDAGPPKKWNAPASKPDIEQSIEITPKKGFKVEIPRGKLVAKLNASFTKDDVMTIPIEITILQPTKAGVSDISMTEPAS